MFKKTLAIAVLATASAGAMAQTYTIVRIAPPAPIVETVPAPRSGYVWTPGYYDHRGGNYSWVEGNWVRERPGYEWREARWVQTGNGEWRRVGNTWERRGPNGDRDGDGIANRDDVDKDGDGIRNRDDNRPNRANYAANRRGPNGDLDRDGIANRHDRDRDGDGVRNNRDRYPDDRRYN